MAELAAIVAAFKSLADTASKIQKLGETYYEKSAEWEDFNVKVDRLRRQGDVWLEAFKNYGISDTALIGSLNEATALLKIEEEKLLDREESKGIVYACVTRCCSRLHVLVFPEEAGRRIQRVVDAFEAIPSLLKLKKEANAAAENESSNMPYLLSFHNDKRYVPLEDTELKIHSMLKNSTGASTGPIVVLLHGGPGKGKSALARHVALHYNNLRNEDPKITDCTFDQVIFLECGPEVKTSAKQLELLQHLAVDITQDKQQSTSDLRISQQLQWALRSRKILIVFDDVWEREFLQHMMDLCGNEVKCLVTSQNGDLCSGLNCPFTPKILIQDISQELARKILASHAGFTNQDIPHQKIMDVIDRMIRDTDGNPLALASIVSTVDVNQREDPGEWEEAYGLVRQSLKTKPTPYIFSQQYPRSFWSVMHLSILSLREEAQKVLLLMHLCKGPSVPEEVIRFLHQITKFKLEAVTFRKLAAELEGRELVKINTNSCNTYHSERSWSTHSLQKLFMEEDEDMREKKQVMFQSLLGFSSAVDSKPPVGSEIGPETLQDGDALLKTIFCALYFEDQFAKKAAAQLNIVDDRFNDLRRKAFEPITRLVGQSMTQRWTPVTQEAAKQVFVQYFHKCELDSENISVLLKTSAYPSVQLATLDAIDAILLAGETPLLTENIKLLPSLVSFLADNQTPVLQEKAAGCLWQLATYDDDYRLKILNEEGSLPGLVSSLSKDDNHKLQEYVAATFINLALGEDTIKLSILKQEGALAALVRSLLKVENAKLQECAAFAMGNLSSGPDSCKLQIVEGEGAVAALVESLLKDDNHKLQEHAAATFVNLASGEDIIKFSILKQQGALAALVRSLLKEENAKLQEYAAWAMWNLSHGPGSCKLQLVEGHGALAALVESLSKDDNHKLQEYAAATFVNLALGEDTIKPSILKQEGALAVLVRSLSKEENAKLQEYAAWAIFNLSHGSESCKLQIVEGDGALAALVESLSKDSNHKLQEYVAKTFLTLAQGEDNSIKLSILDQEGALGALVGSLLKKENARLQEYAAWAMCNLAHGPKACKLQIMEGEGAVASLVESLLKDDNHKLQEFAAGTFVNLAWGEDTIKPSILKQEGVLAALVTSLAKEENAKLQEYAALAMCNLAYGPESCKLQIVEGDGALEALMKLLSKDDNPKLQEHVVRTFLCLTSGGDTIKLQIVEGEGVVAALVESLLKDDNHKLQENAAATFVNLASGEDTIKLSILKQQGVLAALVRSLSKGENAKLQECAALAMRNLAAGPDSCKLQIVEGESAVVALVESLTKDDNHKLQEHAAATFVNLASGEDTIKLSILKQKGALAVLVRSLSGEENAKLQEYTGWAMHNLCKGPESCKLQIVEGEGALRGLVKSLSKKENPDLQYHAKWALKLLGAAKDEIQLRILEENRESADILKSIFEDSDMVVEVAWID